MVEDQREGAGRMEKFVARAVLVLDTEKGDFIALEDDKGRKVVYEVIFEGDSDIATHHQTNGTPDKIYFGRDPRRSRGQLVEGLRSYVTSKGDFPSEYSVSWEAPAMPSLPDERERRDTRYVKNIF